ncbi:MAG: transposase [Bacteroidota bacterium]
MGYQFTYLYVALNPYTDHLIALLLPNMTKNCFSIFVEHFEKEVQPIYGTQKTLLIADGASNDQQDAINSKRIKLVKLPAACPESNPVERFFEALRTQISNKVFDDVESVEDFLCKILRKYFDEPDTVIQLTCFPYIQND